MKRIRKGKSIGCTHCAAGPDKCVDPQEIIKELYGDDSMYIIEDNIMTRN